jgi:yecA family protein
MNTEQLDGFFTALIGGPDVVPPSEYLPEVFGGEVSDTCEFAGLEEAKRNLGANHAALEWDRGNTSKERCMMA